VRSIKEITEPICQLCVTADTLDEALEFKKMIDESNSFSIGYMSENVINKIEDDYEYNFDVMCKKAGKGYGIKKLLKYLNIPIEETMCFGDYINDYSMFKECDISVAMGNSIPKLKKLADYTTLTNDEDGVASFLEDNLL
jgi:HAD superfamily hydrolase (TIGR01484 family)